MERTYEEVSDELHEITAMVKELLAKRKANRALLATMAAPRVVEAAERLRAVVPNGGDRDVGIEGDSIVLRLDSTTASYLAMDIEVGKNTVGASQIQAVRMLRHFVQWWDSDRAGDTLTYESAHEIAGTAAAAKIVIAVYDRLVREKGESS